MDNWVSPVPGGISITRYLRGSQAVWSKSLWTADITIGPRHTTAAFSSTRNPIDILLKGNKEKFMKHHIHSKQHELWSKSCSFIIFIKFSFPKKRKKKTWQINRRNLLTIVSHNLKEVTSFGLKIIESIYNKTQSSNFNMKMPRSKCLHAWYKKWIYHKSNIFHNCLQDQITLLLLTLIYLRRGVEVHHARDWRTKDIHVE